MRKTNLEICVEHHYYSQIYQSVDVQFSFLQKIKGGYKEMFPKVLCRDYLSDCVIASKMKAPVQGIYGFRSNGCIATDRLYMSVSVIRTKEFLEGLRVIRSLERSFEGDIKPMRVLATQDPKVFILIGDKAWQSSSLTISLLTYILRLINYKRTINYNKIENLMAHILKTVSGGNDKSYTKWISKIDLRGLLSHHDEILGDHPMTGHCDGLIDHTSLNYQSDDDDEEFDEEIHTDSSTNLYSLHDGSGILNMAKAIVNTEAGDASSNGVGTRWVTRYIELLGKRDFSEDLVSPGDMVIFNDIEYEVISYYKASNCISVLDKSIKTLSCKVLNCSSTDVTIIPKES